MIIGITHTQDGEPIQRLAVSTKVAIGLPPDPSKGRKAPMKLDCFIFQKKSEVEQNKWVEDKELTKLFGNKCREFEVVFLDDEIENVFPTKLAWFTASGLKCSGNGETAVRRTEEHPEGQAWGPCGQSCPDFQNKDCKISGDLRFMLAAVPKLGSVTRLHTSGRRSVEQLNSSLQQLKDRFGRLAGIRCKLVVRPEKTSYDGPDGKRHSTTIYALSLEMVAEDMQRLIARTTDHAQLFERTRKMLGTGRIQVIEADEDRAEEIHAEFYPPAEISPAQFQNPEAAIATKEQPNMSVACSSCGQVNGHAADCAAEQSKTQKTDKPVQEAPAMCSECRKIGGHEPDCKFAAKAEPKLAKGVYLLKAVAEKTKKAVPATEQSKGSPEVKYLVLTVLDNNQDGVLYVWHGHLHPLFSGLDLSKPLPMMAEVSKQRTKGKEPKEFFAVEHLLELGAKVFVDDKEQARAEDADGSQFEDGADQATS